MPNLSSILEDNSGGFSSTRLMFLLWGIGVFAVWAITSLKSGSLQVLPETIVWSLAAFMGGKVVQRPFEKSDKK